jgi:hypothetical protein
VAATRIQATWRRFKCRSAYLRYRKNKWAAGVIALTWLMQCKLSQARRKLKEKRARQGMRTK